MSQAGVMMAIEGNRWFARNRNRLGLIDPVSEVLDRAEVRPLSVLEIGCADGWRLEKLRDRYGCAVAGIDCSQEAIRAGAWRNIERLELGTADALPFPGNSFDLVIYGFCLYLCDRTDLLRIATEGDRVLRDGGHLVVHDFYHPDAGTAYRVAYEHWSSLWSYHMNHHELWLSHPSYRRIAHVMHDHDAAVLLKKDHAAAWPVRA